MNPVIQEEETGCAIACSAAIAGISYSEAKIAANKIGIFATDSSLWSESKHICKLLNELNIATDCIETVFKDWQALPGCALLATKWHKENNIPYWHWAIYVRDGQAEYVLDSNASLDDNLIINLDTIQPKWFIKVNL